MEFMEGLRATGLADEYTPWCPRYETEDYSEADPEATPTDAVLAWDPDDGFMLEVTRRSPDTSDRWGVTSIDAKGNVTFERASAVALRLSSLSPLPSSLSPGWAGGGTAYFSGWRQRRPGKRAKSRSVVTSSAPDSMARAAR